MTRNFNPLASYGTTRDKVVSFQGKIAARSKAAVLFIIVPTGQQYDQQVAEADDYDKTWFPLSQTKSIHETFSLVNGTMDTIVVSEWIAKQKELI